MVQRYDHTRAGGIEVDQLFDALSHPVRRRILAALRARERRSVDEFATGGSTPGAAAERRAAVSLHHNHIPHLVDAGYVQWDREGGTVTRGPRFDEFRSFFTLMNEHEDELSLDWPTG